MQKSRPNNYLYPVGWDSDSPDRLSAKVCAVPESLGAEPKGQDMTFDPTKYGLSLTDPAGSLVKAQEALSALVESIGASGATLADAEKKVREDAANFGEVLSGYDAVGQAREAVFGEWERPDMTLRDWLYMAAELKKLATDVRDYADYLVTEEARKSRPAVPADVLDKKSDAESLRDFIVSLFGVCKMMNQVPDSFPTKKNKAGEIVPDLDRLPNVSASGGNVGRGAKIRGLRYTIDGEAVPAGTLFDELCFRYLSDSDRIIKPKELREKIGSDQFFEGWTIMVNGHEVTGAVPVDGAADEVPGE